MTWTPTCMTPDEWASWLDADRQVPAHGRALRPCADCPAEWMRQQLEEGSCNRREDGMPSEREARLLAIHRERNLRYRETHPGTASAWARENRDRVNARRRERRSLLSAVTADLRVAS